MDTYINGVKLGPSIGTKLFGDYPIQFGQYLSEQGREKSTIQLYLRHIDILAELMKANGIAISDLDEEQAATLIAKIGWAHTRKTYATCMVKCFVRFLVEHGLAKLNAPPTAKEIARVALKQDFETFLRRQRGMSERTIISCWQAINHFLEFRFGTEVGDLTQITPIDIVGFLQQRIKQNKPLPSKTLPAHLRSFFGYLFRSNKTAVNLAPSVPRVAQRFATRLPRHISAEQVDVLLRAVRNDTPIGRRNYAMVILLARLGLRAQEVVAMQLDDIDWRAGEIVVRGKGKRYDRVPLPSDVGEALADYIRLGRTTTSRTLFVTDQAPHRPFEKGGIVNCILKEASAKTGVELSVPYVGSHILRHSLAVNLVQHGASLDEIGNVLRHRARASTMLYARLDVEGLRSVAQVWPGDGGDNEHSVK
jgi:site-specific recombinase XerD